MIKRILLTVVVAMLATQTFSQDTLKLEEVRVTGISLRAKKTASRVEVSKRNTLASETPAYLSNMGSVTWQSDNGTQFGYSYLRIRGMDQQRISFTVNGIPLNDGEDMGVYTSNITDLLSSTKEVRITRGSGGALSGNPVFAGSVEMDLFVPDSSRQEIEIGGGSFGSYRTSILIGTQNLKFRGSLTGTDGWRDHSWGKSSSYALTYRKTLGKWLFAFNSLAGNTRNAQAWWPVPDGMSIRSNVLDPEEKDHFFQTINQLQAATKAGKHGIVISPYWIHLKGNYSYSIDPNTLGNLRLKWNNFGGYFAIKRNEGDFRYSVGATLNSHRRDHIGAIEPYLTRPTYQNFGRKLDASAFVKLDYRGPLRIEGDLQYRKSRLDYNSPDLNFRVFEYDFFNWRAMFSQEFGTFTPYFMISRSHREPTRTDIFGYVDHYDPSNVGDLRSVRAEKVTDFEAGISHKKSRLNLFWMEYSNEIVTLGDINFLGIQVRTNTPKSRRYGIEGETLLETKIVDFTGNFCLMKALDVRSGLRTPFSPALVYNLSISKEKKGWKAEIWFRRSSSQRLDYSTEEISEIRGFSTLNILAEKNIKKVTLRTGINNLLDKPYVTAGNLNYDTGTGKPLSRNSFWQSGISFFSSINVQL